MEKQRNREGFHIRACDKECLHRLLDKVDSVVQKRNPTLSSYGSTTLAGFLCSGRKRMTSRRARSFLPSRTISPSSTEHSNRAEASSTFYPRMLLQDEVKVRQFSPSHPFIFRSEIQGEVALPLCRRDCCPAKKIMDIILPDEHPIAVFGFYSFVHASLPRNPSPRR